MVNHTKHRKILYVPGMISLVLLPLLCLYHFYENKSFTTYSSFSFTIADTLFNEKPKQELLQNNFYLPKRNFKAILFNGPKESDDIKLKRARSDIQQIYRMNDSINGVKFVFGNKAIYETYIDALDILTIDDITYLPYKNEIFVLHVPKKISKNLKTIPRFISCGFGEANRDYYRKIEREKERQFLISLFKQKWTVLLAYLGILILNILTLVKFNKNRKYNLKSYL